MRKTFLTTVMSRFMTTKELNDFERQYQENLQPKRTNYYVITEEDLEAVKTKDIKELQKLWGLKAKETVLRRLGQHYYNSLKL